MLSSCPIVNEFVTESRAEAVNAPLILVPPYLPKEKTYLNKIAIGIGLLQGVLTV